ncbi:xanthine dehydrogenase family protein molybdopterin-binding subunit [Candidatus Palauibacter sp.]|uniref:xanthine dehydrogenase family protein molybdopterin-binding subunit n=1 Tax=Candidatus Palauibacter sp. TaxID=3101350 RepID=UPI003B026322
MATAVKYVGGGVPRKEDPKLLTGQGQFVEGLTLPGMLHMALVRSPFGSARINSVDVSAAAAADGVVAAFSGADLAGEWAAGLPMAWPVTDDIRIPDHWPVAQDVARYVGDAVAVVVATSRNAALDAAELVEVDYEVMEAVVDVEAALADGAPRVHESFDDNKSYTWTLTNGDVDAAFAKADVVVKERYRQPRLIPNAMEPRAVVVQSVPAAGDFTVWSTTQIPHVAKVLFALTLGIPESQIRVIAPDVGGGFGSKLNVYAEEALCIALARRLRRPVKWVASRSEGYVATIHGRDQVQEIEIAATSDGEILGYRVNILAAMGAYLQLVAPGVPLLGAFLYCGCYGGEAYHFECTGVFTNTTPTDAYRGAGRPEATYAIERAMDVLAREVGVDATEIRRRNFLPAGDMVQSPGGLAFDSANYEPALDRAVELLDYAGFRSDQAERRESGAGKQIGVGFSSYVEICGLAPSQVLASLKYAAGGWDAATVRMLPTGKAEVVTGSSPHGQGHVTSWSQIAADALGIPYEDVTVLHGDTHVAPHGMNTYGSRSLAVAGVAVYKACGRVVDKARLLAAHLLEVAPEDLDYEAGTFSVKGVPDRTKSMPELAFAAWTAHSLPEDSEPGLEAGCVYDPPNFTFPFGTHVAVVEVDTDTGAVELLRYIAVDDCGPVINPVIVDGQVHGGVAQGIAAALYEEATYAEDGTLETSSMINYLVPSAAEFPYFETDRTVTPSTSNPMGVKGIGEAGTIGSAPAVINAVVDALAHLGVTDVPMPATPERVWRAIQAAQGGEA